MMVLSENLLARLPVRTNSIGIIDGQHRLYSYYRSRDDDSEIARLRSQQNLLVTGIIYPENTAPAERERFEASLFLSINSNQTGAPPDLKQEIEVVLNPFSPTAIGKQVIQMLARVGPLSGHVETFFYEKGKLKTSSIVSYGLGPLLKMGGDDSLHAIFSHPEKAKLASRESQTALDAYLQFSLTHINMFLSAVKANVPEHRWTSDRGQSDRLLTVTYINAFLITLRLLVANKKPTDFQTLKNKLEGVGKFNFKAFHSSQYNRMAEKLYLNYFA